MFHFYKQLVILLGKKCKWPPGLQDGGITTFHWFKVEDDRKKKMNGNFFLGSENANSCFLLFI